MIFTPHIAFTVDLSIILKTPNLLFLMNPIPQSQTELLVSNSS